MSKKIDFKILFTFFTIFTMMYGQAIYSKLYYCFKLVFFHIIEYINNIITGLYWSQNMRKYIFLAIFIYNICLCCIGQNSLPTTNHTNIKEKIEMPQYDNPIEVYSKHCG